MFDIVREEYLRKWLRSKYLFIQAHLLLPRAAACTFSGSMHIDSAQANDLEIKKLRRGFSVDRNSWQLSEFADEDHC